MKCRILPALATLLALFLLPSATVAQVYLTYPDNTYRWAQVQGPNVIGHRQAVGVGMAGNGKWITTRAYINGESQQDLVSNRGQEGSRTFGDPVSREALENLNLYYSPLAEVDNAGLVYSLFGQGFTHGRVTRTGLDGALELNLYDDDPYGTTSKALDLGVNDDGILWKIGTEDATGGYAVSRYDPETERWIIAAGQGGVRVDVDPLGFPWVVTRSNDLYRWDGETWLRKGDKARDVAVGSDGTVWVANGGEVRRLVARERGQYAVWETFTFDQGFDAVNIAAGQGGEAIVSDSQGRLWRAFVDTRSPELDVAAATGAFDPELARDIATLGPLSITTTESVRTNIALTDGGAISTWFQVGDAQDSDALVIDAETAAMLKSEFTDEDLLNDFDLVVGSNDPGCLMSHSNARETQFSICFSPDYNELDIQLGRDSGSVPVEDAIGSTQHLFVTFENEGEDGDFTVRAWLNGTALGPWFFDGNRAFDLSNRTTFTIGSGANGANPFGGRIGTTRIWSDAPDAAAVNAAPFAHQADVPGLPGYRDLVLEASMASPGSEIELTDPSLLPEIYWHSARHDTFNPTPQQNTKLMAEHKGATAIDVAVDFVMPDVFRLRIEDQSEPGLPNTLTIFRDGEAGVSEATFEQVGRNAYRGIRSPIDDSVGTIEFSLEFDSVPVILNGREIESRAMTTVIGNERLYAVIPYPEFGPTRADYATKLSDRIKEYRRSVGSDAKVAVSDSFAFENMARRVEFNFRGHDVTKMSPMPGIARKPYRNKIFDMFDPTDENSRNYTVQVPVVIPWGTNYFAIQHGAVHQVETVATTTREYQESFGFGLGGSVEIPGIANFSNNTDFKNSTATMRETSSTAIYSNANYTFYALVADRARMNLDAKFKRAVLDLRDGVMSFDQFFEDYGTHFAHAVSYGQRARFETMISKTGFKNEITDAWSTENSGGFNIKGFSLDVTSKIEEEKGRAFEDSREYRQTRSIVEGGTLSNSQDEMTLGDNQDTVVPVAFDLRPIWRVLSPLYFDDPAIYRDLRSRMQPALYEYSMSFVDRELISNEQFTPQVVRVQADSLTPTGGNSKKMYGKIEVVVRQPDGTEIDRETLWEASAAEAVETDASTTTGSSHALVDAFHDFDNFELGVSTTGFWDLRFEIVANVQFVGSGDDYAPASRSHLPQEFAAGKEPFAPVTVGKNCTCFAQCEPGYEAVGNACLKECPANFDARGSDTCYGSYDMNFEEGNRGDMYWAWEMDQCERDWHHLGCERVDALFGSVVTKCEENYFRTGHTLGICVPDCEAFGLDKWAGSNFTCSRPEKDRATQPMAPGTNLCPAGYERSNASNACPHISVQYSMQRLVDLAQR